MCHALVACLLVAVWDMWSTPLPLLAHLLRVETTTRRQRAFERLAHVRLRELEALCDLRKRVLALVSWVQAKAQAQYLPLLLGEPCQERLDEPALGSIVHVGSKKHGWSRQRLGKRGPVLTLLDGVVQAARMQQGIVLYLPSLVEAREHIAREVDGPVMAAGVREPLANSERGIA